MTIIPTLWYSFVVQYRDAVIASNDWMISECCCFGRRNHKHVNVDWFWSLSILNSHVIYSLNLHRNQICFGIFQGPICRNDVHKTSVGSLSSDVWNCIHSNVFIFFKSSNDLVTYIVVKFWFNLDCCFSFARTMQRTAGTPTNCTRAGYARPQH